MLAFLASLFIGLLALVGAFFRLLSRSTSFRKSRSGLSPREVKGEEFQDISAIFATFATFLVVIAAIFIVDAEVTREVRFQASLALAVLWFCGLAYIGILNKKYRAPDSEGDTAKAQAEQP